MSALNAERFVVKDRPMRWVVSWISACLLVLMIMIALEFSAHADEQFQGYYFIPPKTHAIIIEPIRHTRLKLTKSKWTDIDVYQIKPPSYTYASENPSFYDQDVGGYSPFFGSQLSPGFIQLDDVSQPLAQKINAPIKIGYIQDYNKQTDKFTQLMFAVKISIPIIRPFDYWVSFPFADLMLLQ